MLATNLFAGALLALLGVGILVADLRDAGSSAVHSGASRQKKAVHDGSLAAPRLYKVSGTVARFV